MLATNPRRRRIVEDRHRELAPDGQEAHGLRDAFGDPLVDAALPSGGQLRRDQGGRQQEDDGGHEVEEDRREAVDRHRRRGPQACHRAGRHQGQSDPRDHRNRRQFLLGEKRIGGAHRVRPLGLPITSWITSTPTTPSLAVRALNQRLGGKSHPGSGASAGLRAVITQGGRYGKVTPFSAFQAITRLRQRAPRRPRGIEPPGSVAPRGTTSSRPRGREPRRAARSRPR